MSWSLYVDDLRMPPKDGRHYVIARSTDEAKKQIDARGMPSYISFDFDLGGTDRAIDLVKWLIEQDITSAGELIPDEFQYNVHSANLIGAETICALLNNYIGYKRGEHASE